jgi:hypothetical protein
VPKNAEPGRQRDKLVPKHERVIKEDTKEISKIIGKQKSKRKKRKEKGKGERKNS